MTDVREEVRAPKFRWAAEGEMATHAVGINSEVTLLTPKLRNIQFIRNGWKDVRLAVIAEPAGLKAVAEECTNAIASCEPTDWEENYAAILAVLERHQ